jgi:predicted ATP-dependent protease
MHSWRDDALQKWLGGDTCFYRGDAFMSSYGLSKAIGRLLTSLVVGFCLFTPSAPALAKANADARHWREQLIHILGTTQGTQSQPIGVVAEVVIGLEQRADHRGTEIIFEEKAGNFSDRTQGAIMLAIDRTARAARLNPDSWSIFLSFDSPGMTLHGDSLSAMVGLTVIALAKGDTVQFNRAITGTITNDGHIGVVSGIPFKIAAAHLGHMQRVLIPDEADATDPDWRVPFLMHVSPVGSVSDAYQALTDRPLVAEPDQR